MPLETIDDDVSVALLAGVLGITERWVQQLERQGVLEKTGRGRYALAKSVQAYIKFKVESEVARATPDASNPGERVKAERARKLKLENDETELRTIAMTAALETLDAIVGPLKADLAGVPATVTDDIAERRRIEDAIESVTARLADRFAQAGAALRTGGDPYSADGENDA